MMGWRRKKLEIDRKHEVAGRAVPLRIVENARARRLILRLGPGGRSLRVTVPPGVSLREVDRFLCRHREWIEERVRKLPDRDRLEAGMLVPFRGVPHRIIQRTDLARAPIRTGKDEHGPFIETSGDPALAGRRIAEFLKSEARREIGELVARHSARIGVTPGKITLRDTRSRWGSCSSTGALSFSWRIMMAPPAVIDYLAAHEVAHLREMNHGAAFWRICRELCPRTDECRDWLKRNGSALQAIPFSCR